MPNQPDLIDAMELGQQCRKKAIEYNALFNNPFIDGTNEADAWTAGFENDLNAWMEVRQRTEARPSTKKPIGRLRAHDSITMHAHTSRPNHGEFLGYTKGRPGWARVLLDRGGFQSVPTCALTRREKKAVA